MRLPTREPDVRSSNREEDRSKAQISSNSGPAELSISTSGVAHADHAKNLRAGPEPPRLSALSWLKQYGWQAIIATFTMAAIAASLFLRFAFHRPDLQTWPLFAALLLCGIPLLWDLLRQALRLEFGSDWLAGLSIVSATLLHEYLVACIVVLMLSGGAALEQYATRRASSALLALAKRMPTVAHREETGGTHEVAIQEIAVGDTLIVFPHELCPVDGDVIEGHGEMDESYLTGEPFEMAKAPGSQVLSGAVNGNTALKIRATRLSVDSRYARILGVVEEAEQNRPRMRRIADRLGGWYTPIALAVAIAGWLLSGSAERFLAVLVIATPCPLLIGIPVAIIGSISLAARRGIIIKRPKILEQIDGCEVFFFDKTGTLTYGRPVLTDVLAAPGLNTESVLSWAASLEQYSRHPLAQAILDAAKVRKLPISIPAEVSEKPGHGLSGKVAGHMVHVTGRKQAIESGWAANEQLPSAESGLECIVVIDGSYAALMRFHDEPRADSRAFIGHLQPKHRAHEVVLLSGDRRQEVEHLARIVGIEQIHAGATPEEKLSMVAAETRRRKTLFIGDGINDAPAMLAATASVALGGQNSDVTAEAADAVVMDSSLRKVDELMHISRRARSIALQTAIGGMVLSGVGMLFAAGGLLPPIGGAIAQEVIDLAAVLNSLRVTRVKSGLSDF